MIMLFEIVGIWLLLKYVCKLLLYDSVELYVIGIVIYIDDMVEVVGMFYVVLGWVCQVVCG